MPVVHIQLYVLILTTRFTKVNGEPHMVKAVQENLHQQAPLVKKWRTLVEQSFTVRMSLLVVIREKTLEFSSTVLPAPSPYISTLSCHLNQPPRTTKPGPSSVGRSDKYWRWSQSLLGKKQQVLHYSRGCWQ